MLKTTFFGLIVGFLGCASVSFSDELHCASKANQDLYFTSGQIRLTAEVNSPELLSQVRLSTTGSQELGFSEDEIQGEVKGKYVRFYASDAWCNYKLSTLKSFSTSETAVVYLEASCEESNNYSIRLNCRID